MTVTEGPRPLPADLEMEVVRLLEFEGDRRETELRRCCAAHPDEAGAIRDYVAVADDVAAAFRAMPRPQPDTLPPESIGPYRILDVLGQGGMGTVYLAEQTEPLRRRVALKVIRLGMDSAQIRARFAVERRSLASMNHDHIARLYDAGLTERGQSFFAMEYVDGVPLDRHCDQRMLSTAERLELFLRVCEGVRHAHQKGVIHRDLKPSNILVSTVGDRAVPKIIDFGLARAIEPTVDEQTSATYPGQLVGTLGYMSPEQVAGEFGSVDTRTDVFALGVVLNKLLVGTLPFGLGARSARSARSPRQWQDSGDYRRWLREDPPRPSTRLSQLREAAGEIAACRGTDPRALARVLRGDLDWITVRALEPDRERRYQSVGDLADDLRRHLRHEPVLAAGRRTGYRLGKLVRRHRLAVIAGSLVLLASLAGLAGILWQAEIAREQAANARTQTGIAREQERIAHQQTRIAEGRLLEVESALAAASAVNEFLTVDLLDSANPERARGQDVKVADVLELAARRVGTRFAEQPVIQAAVRYALGETFDHLGMDKEARTQHETALALRREHLGRGHCSTLASAAACASMLLQFGDAKAAESALRETIEASRRSLGDGHRSTLRIKVRLALCLRLTNRGGEALALYREVLGVQQQTFGKRDDDTLFTMEMLGQALGDAQRFAEAIAVLRETLALRREVSGNVCGRTWGVMNVLACIYKSAGDYAAAEPLFREALQVAETMYGDDHPQYSKVLNNLAGLLMVKALGDRASDPASDRMAAAEAMFRKVVVIRKRSWGPQSHDVAIALNNLALTLLEQGKLARARDAFEESLAIQERHPEMTRRTRITTRYNLATLAGELGKHEEAARLAAELVPDAEAAYGAGHSMLAEIRQFHGVCLVKLGRFAAAEEQFLAAHAIAAAALGEHARLTVILIEKTRNFYRFRVRRGDAGKQAALEIWQARLQAARAGAAGR